jgi:hypothetical protein
VEVSSLFGRLEPTRSSRIGSARRPRPPITSGFGTNLPIRDVLPRSDVGVKAEVPSRHHRFESRPVNGLIDRLEDLQFRSGVLEDCLNSQSEDYPEQIGQDRVALDVLAELETVARDFPNFYELPRRMAFRVSGLKTMFRIHAEQIRAELSDASRDLQAIRYDRALGDLETLQSEADELLEEANKLLRGSDA